MAFSVNMTAAARRHLLAAEMLVGTDRRDVAAYLYGIAAECAVKAMMPGIGLRPKADHKTPDDPYFAHFPDLRTMLRDVVSKRRGIPLARLIQNDGFLNGWSTQMRYSDGREINPNWINSWAQQARERARTVD